MKTKELVGKKSLEGSGLRVERFRETERPLLTPQGFRDIHK